MLRLVLALVGGHGGPVLECMPVPVQAMLGLLKTRGAACPSLALTRGAALTGDSLLTHLMAVWWEYNGCTPFMAHHLTAKLVRRMVKDLERAEEVFED